MAPLADIWSFPLWPETASATARGVDHLYIFLLIVCGGMTIAIFSTIFYFAIKYRRRSPDERPRPLRGSLGLEFFWAAGPLAIFLFTFGWGAKVFFENSSPPPGAMQVYVVGKQWMWYLQHPEGQREINELHVPVNRPVELIITSQDVIHSFYVPAFRIKRDAVPGMYNTTWFLPIKTGTFHLFCAEYCGTEHSHMIGSVYVMSQSDYERWLSGAVGGESMAAVGRRLFQKLGCANCHSRICPPLEGLYMKGVGLEDGRVVAADDAYLRESILDPGAKVVAGFRNIMPSFKGLVTEEALLQLIAYIKSLGSPATGVPAAQPGGQGIQAPGLQPGMPRQTPTKGPELQPPQQRIEEIRPKP